MGWWGGNHQWRMVRLCICICRRYRWSQYQDHEYPRRSGRQPAIFHKVALSGVGVGVVAGESRHCCFGTGPPMIHVNARRRLISPAAVAHVIGSAPARTGRVYPSTKETKHEHEHVRRCCCRAQWGGNCRRCCSHWIGQCLHWWDIPHWWRRTRPAHDLQDYYHAALET